MLTFLHRMYMRYMCQSLLQAVLLKKVFLLWINVMLGAGWRLHVLIPAPKSQSTYISLPVFLLYTEICYHYYHYHDNLPLYLLTGCVFPWVEVLTCLQAKSSLCGWSSNSGYKGWLIGWFQTETCFWVSYFHMENKYCPHFGLSYTEHFFGY